LSIPHASNSFLQTGLVSGRLWQSDSLCTSLLLNLVAGVDNPKRTTYLCNFPRFPIIRPRESNHAPQKQQRQQQPPAYSPPRTLPPYPYSGPQSSPPKRRILPVRPHLGLDVNFVQFDPPPRYREIVSPPPATVGLTKSPSKKKPSVFTSAKPRPLRLVQESLNRKRRPPVFIAQSSHSVVQSLTYITVYSSDSSNKSKMASNPVMPKVTPPLPSLPGGPMSRPPAALGSSPQNKEQLLADLRRQVFRFFFSLPPQRLFLTDAITKA